MIREQISTINTGGLVPNFTYQCSQCEKKSEEVLLPYDDTPEKCECGGDYEKVFTHHNLKYHQRFTGNGKVDSGLYAETRRGTGYGGRI